MLIQYIQWILAGVWCAVLYSSYVVECSVDVSNISDDLEAVWCRRYVHSLLKLHSSRLLISSSNFLLQIDVHVTDLCIADDSFTPLLAFSRLSFIFCRYFTLYRNANVAKRSTACHGTSNITSYYYAKFVFICQKSIWRSFLDSGHFHWVTNCKKALTSHQSNRSADWSRTGLSSNRSCDWASRSGSPTVAHDLVLVLVASSGPPAGPRGVCKHASLDRKRLETCHFRHPSIAVEIWTQQNRSHRIPSWILISAKTSSQPSTSTLSCSYDPR